MALKKVNRRRDDRMSGDLYRILEDPIPADALHDAVLRDSDGAVATFAGVVRDHAMGRPTRYLVYDAYKDMAEKKMEEIGQEVKEVGRGPGGHAASGGSIGNRRDERVDCDFRAAPESGPGGLSLRD
jgi:molybdopterin synthase catalytic subunit